MPSLDVSGMTCASCSLAVRRAAEQVGAQQVYADVSTGRVTFSIEDAEAQVPIVAKAIQDVGYKVRIPEAHTHDKAHEVAPGAISNTLLLIICAILTVPLLAHMWSSWHWLHNPYVQLLLSAPVYTIGVYAFGGPAWRSLKRGSPNMEVLILIGASAAFFYSLTGIIRGNPEKYLFFETAASIVTLVLFGNWLEHRTTQATTSAIDALARLQPQRARIIRTDSTGQEAIVDLDAADLREGDIMLVAEGDALPADGRVVAGSARINEQMLTGESDFVTKKQDSEVTGGTVVVQGNLRVLVTASGEDTALAAIIRLVREAQGNRPPLQKLADKISAWFVPAVIGISLLTFFVSNAILHLPVAESMLRAVAVLVISCPCAMGIATPAAIAVGLGRAARNGILVKGGDTLERLKTIRKIVMDKTGTLTTGELSITGFEAVGISEETFKQVVVALESASSHPIAQSIVGQWRSEAAGSSRAVSLTDIAEVKGKGMEGHAGATTWRLGSKGWLGNQQSFPFDLLLFEDDNYRGGINLEDTLRPDAAQAIATLKERGYHPVLLSGDTEAKCSVIAAATGIEEWYAQKTPGEKHQMIAAWNKETPTAMVGDGINDAPSLAAATVGISLGNASQIAIQSAQIILSGNRLALLPKAIRLGILTEATIRSNLGWAFLYNVLAIPIAAAGYLSPTWGAGVMALSDVVLALNSMRLAVRRL